MKTKPIYLINPYIKEIDAVVVDIVAYDNNQVAVILDQTCCYPVGGGQSCDTAKLILDDVTSLKVTYVVIKNGEINHFVESLNGLVIGQKVKIVLDWDRRYQNMITHSVGHVIDFALQKLELVLSILKPIKGSRGKKAYIEYEGVVNVDELKIKLNSEINKILISNLKF